MMAAVILAGYNIIFKITWAPPKLLPRLQKQQVKHLLRKINAAQQYYAGKLYTIIQIPADDMIADTDTKT